MASRPLNSLSLCAGVGGIDLGLHVACGGGHRTVGFVERDAYAAAVLVARMEDASLDQAPVWDDLTSFVGRSWRGVVDLVTAGFPCQPFSDAGQRRGLADDRWLWPSIAPIIADCEPALVFLENVPGLVRHGLPVVLQDLASLGFDAEWGLLRASEVGASHERERLYLLAAHPDRTDVRDEHWWGFRQGREGEAVAGDDGAPRPVAHRAGKRLEGTGEGSHPSVADADRVGRQGKPDAPQRGTVGRAAAGRSGETVAYTERPERWSEDEPRGRGGEGCDLERQTSGRPGEPGDVVADALGVGQREPDDPRRPGARDHARPDASRYGIFAPAPDDERWAQVLTEMPSLEPAFCGVADATTGRLDRSGYRADRLRCVGNCVVPLAVAHAWCELMARFA